MTSCAVNKQAQRRDSALMRTARLHDGIKQIVRGSEKITNEAINAMLRAKRVGEQARGFGTATAELRRFSAQLSAVMTELRADIGAQVTNVAEIQRDLRSLYYQRRIVEAGSKGSHYLRDIVADKERHLAELRTRTCAEQKELERRLHHAEKLCRIGLSIARAAKIEAVYGGALAAGLRQVADAIERHVEELQLTVKALLREAQQCLAAI